MQTMWAERVTSAKGPEAGVWVIAETADLRRSSRASFVTDDDGRYVIPDLPKATYTLWVRGYGLVDSAKGQGDARASRSNLTAVIAPDARAAAAYYPAGYWWSLLRVPAASEFPGTGASGNGISPALKSQADWLRTMKSAPARRVISWGNKATRELSPALGTFESSTAAWERRLQSGQAGMNMIAGCRPWAASARWPTFADWTDRIAAGALPPVPLVPAAWSARIVITQWDWADRRPTCTIRCRPTDATRRSTRTG